MLDFRPHGLTGAPRFARRARFVAPALLLLLMVALWPAPLSARVSTREQIPDAQALKTQRHLLSVDVFGGMFVFSDDAVKAAPYIGGRVTWLPRWYLGAELDLGYMEGLGAVYTVRLGVLLQYPAGRRAALFGVAGAGVLGSKMRGTSTSHIVGPAAYWGGGVKIHLTDALALRVDFRHLLTFKLPGIGVNHFECTVAMSIVLNWTPDRDGDGIEDARDRCPRVKGGSLDGCPMRAASVLQEAATSPNARR